MCEPATLLQIVGLGLGIGGRLASGRAANRAGISELNTALKSYELLKKQAALGREQAEYAATKGQFDINRLIDGVDQVFGAQTVAALGGNLDPTYGSPLTMQGETAAQAAVDIGLIRAGAGIEASNALFGAANTQMTAVNVLGKGLAARRAGSDAMLSSIYGAATTFLGKAANLFDFGGSTVDAGPMSLAPASPGNALPFGVY